MPLYYDAGQSARPSIHALIIGVGGYPYLSGGATINPQITGKIGTLRQLTSPPRSALALADWLRSNPAGWNVPLGTIDLLVSPAHNDALAVPANVLPASIANIQLAYDDWRARCDGDPDNVAFFYFCGHGVEKADQYLLAEDFGAISANPWRGAFAFDKTRQSFHDCRARTQWFFVDACRRITSAMLSYEPNASALGTLNWTAPECDYNLTVKAAARNEAAFGPPLGTAFFTQALMQSFDGAVAIKQGNRWIVETGQMAAQINKVLGLVKVTEGYSQRCTSVVNVSTSARSVSTPTVKVVVDCNPELANQHALVTCEGPLPPDQPIIRKVVAPWKEEIPAGTYRADAVFPNKQHRDATTYFTAYPPSYPAKLECK